jgi:hypothetical protein
MTQMFFPKDARPWEEGEPLRAIIAANSRKLCNLGLIFALAEPLVQPWLAIERSVAVRAIEGCGYARSVESQRSLQHDLKLKSSIEIPGFCG